MNISHAYDKGSVNIPYRWWYQGYLGVMIATLDVFSQASQSDEVHSNICFIRRWHSGPSFVLLSLRQDVK